MNARSIVALAFACLALATLAVAHNCSATSVGFAPLPELGTALYQGEQGGLYAGGSNVRPIAHTVEGMREATLIVPRDAAGAPDPAGKIIFLSIGMSNCGLEFGQFVIAANADPAKRACVVPVNAGQGGQTASVIRDPLAPYWAFVDARLAQFGCTREQVGAIWLQEANEFPTGGFPAATLALEQDIRAVLGILRTTFPNLHACYIASRVYAGYATNLLNPEPYAYEQGFACKWLIEDQIAGVVGSTLASIPWIDWGTYNWADGLTPAADGLFWECADFGADGTHPSIQGRDKVAARLLAYLHADPIASSWYLAAPAPSAYGVGKTTSLATVPAVSWSGTPSFAAANFVFRYSGGIPNSFGLGLVGDAPAALPFFGGTRYVASPFDRLPIQTLNGSGAGAFPIAIDASMVGTTMFLQGYLRDAAHVDGTGVGLTNGLRVVVAP